jgi:hypothetical protein
MGNFLDGITSLFNGLANRRNVVANNAVYSQRIGYEQLRQIAKTGLGSKIIRLKAGYSLNDTLQFSSTEDRIFYERALQKEVKRAGRNMLAYGRGIIVIYERGKSLSEPMSGIPDMASVRIRGFAGDMVTATDASVDLNDVRYLKPRFYSVRGVQIHHTRVVDFRYVEPPELDLPQYQYGGISEFELIYSQIINDGIVERAAPAILEKNATLFYKVKDFKDLMMAGREDDLLKYFARLEDGRSVYGAGLIDAEDDAFVLDQTLTNLADVDMITLRRLAMVTGIPLALLVGENVKGLNSTGDNERAAFQDMIETLQSDYLLDPINDLMRKLGQGFVEFKDNQGQTAGDRMMFETQAIANAEKLYIMGEDHRGYLERHAVVEKDDFSLMFPEPKDDYAAPDQV